MFFWVGWSLCKQKSKYVCKVSWVLHFCKITVCVHHRDKQIRLQTNCIATWKLLSQKVEKLRTTNCGLTEELKAVHLKLRESVFGESVQGGTPERAAPATAPDASRDTSTVQQVSSQDDVFAGDLPTLLQSLMVRTDRPEHKEPKCSFHAEQQVSNLCPLQRSRLGIGCPQRSWQWSEFKREICRHTAEDTLSVTGQTAQSVNPFSGHRLWTHSADTTSRSLGPCTNTGSKFLLCWRAATASVHACAQARKHTLSLNFPTFVKHSLSASDQEMKRTCSNKFAKPIVIDHLRFQRVCSNWDCNRKLEEFLTNASQIINDVIFEGHLAQEGWRNTGTARRDPNPDGNAQSHHGRVFTTETRSLRHNGHHWATYTKGNNCPRRPQLKNKWTRKIQELNSCCFIASSVFVISFCQVEVWFIAVWKPTFL